MEITPVTFRSLHERLLDQVRHRIRNGEITERRLARTTGISQSHLHNSLKGVRGLSPQYADLLLRHFRLTLVDLLLPEEAAPLLARHPTRREVLSRPIPLLDGLLGPGNPAPLPGNQSYPVPLALAETTLHPCAVRLAADPEMDPVCPNGRVILLDHTAPALLESGAYYILETPEGLRLRTLHIDGGRRWVITERTRATPAAWRELDCPVRARVHFLRIASALNGR